MSENEPAFPLSTLGHTQQGMTLRDWFAGQALTSVLANATNVGSIPVDERKAAWSATAGIMYELADAMLAARAK